MDKYLLGIICLIILSILIIFYIRIFRKDIPLEESSDKLKDGADFTILE